MWQRTATQVSGRGRGGGDGPYVARAERIPASCGNCTASDLILRGEMWLVVQGANVSLEVMVLNCCVLYRKSLQGVRV